MNLTNVLFNGAKLLEDEYIVNLFYISDSKGNIHKTVK